MTLFSSTISGLRTLVSPTPWTRSPAASLNNRFGLLPFQMQLLYLRIYGYIICCRHPMSRVTLPFDFRDLPKFWINTTSPFELFLPDFITKTSWSRNMASCGPFLLLWKSASLDSNARLLAVSPVSISNELYGWDTMSAFELEKGYTKPFDNSILSKTTPDEIISAHNELLANRKLTHMLRSNATNNVIQWPWCLFTTVGFQKVYTEFKKIGTVFLHPVPGEMRAYRWVCWWLSAVSTNAGIGCN